MNSIIKQTMNKQKIWGFFISVCTIITTGCSLTPKPADKTFFMLEFPECQEASKKTGPSLLISEKESAAFLNSTRIIYRDSVNERSFYQLAFWVESPSDAIIKLISHRLECDGIFSDIEIRSSILPTQYQLSLQLNEFMYDVVYAPGVVRLKLTAELLDLKTHRVKSRRNFIIEDQVEGPKIKEFIEMKEIINGFQRLSGKFQDQLSSWIKVNAF